MPRSFCVSGRLPLQQKPIFACHAVDSKRHHILEQLRAVARLVRMPAGQCVTCRCCPAMRSDARQQGPAVCAARNPKLWLTNGSTANLTFVYEPDFWNLGSGKGDYRMRFLGTTGAVSREGP